MDPVTTEPLSEAMNPFNSSVHPEIFPTHTFDDAPVPDVLLVPGGLGTRAPSLNHIIDYIGVAYPKFKYLITVCADATWAGRAGVLDGKQATMNKASWNSTITWCPEVNRCHMPGGLSMAMCTSSGISARIDATVAFIKHPYGTDTTRVTKLMEYERREYPNWDPFSEIFHVPGA
ncbi:uncharacterized protein ATNIH1004_001723 [Aspergillus tanneri]|uniref:DJ-1/PfpI domain-containing protein n=1 Tax=Aspergillus tanneri TaxID=1220188 RepID=A0A5M9N0E7_9EURO|nr:uncharacterized protein ATNIH1004_001723 [Aspergillus tanneri]KAA8652815.1 hypothetical protein ATNIH1004_001723 [Aspergillus tanneri]